MSERDPFAQGELRNNNRRDRVVAEGDANANDIQAEDRRTPGDVGTRSGPAAKQGEAAVWDTEPRCDDPELAEFEMLECQELEECLAGEGNDFVGLTDRQELYRQPSNVPAEPPAGGGSNAETRSVPGNEAPRPSENRGEAERPVRTEFNSDNDVFVSCLSTMSSLGGSLASALDTAGRTHNPSAPDRTASEDLTQASLSCHTASDRIKFSPKADRGSPASEISTTRRKDVDMNRNTTVFSEIVTLEAQLSNGVPCKKHILDSEENKKRNQTYELDNNNGVIHETATEHNDLHTEKEPFEESNKIDKSTQADEAQSMTHNQVKSSIKEVQSLGEHKAVKKQASFDNTPSKQMSLDKTFKKQPSFESSIKKQLSFDDSMKKQGSFENSHNYNPSSLERRKPWGSPSRPATSVSPKRRTPSSPAKVQATRAPSADRGDSTQKASVSVKQPSKVCVNSGIPKPISAPQRQPETQKCSPPQKPKNVRPKIITYIHKNPQAKQQATDTPHEASVSPLRLSSYPSPPPHKETKAGPDHRSTAVPCSSSLLFHKHRQEMQKAGYYSTGMVVIGVKVASTMVPQRMSGKSESFHGELPGKRLTEHASAEAGHLYHSPGTPRPQHGLGAVPMQPAAKAKLLQNGHRSTNPSQSTPAAGGTTHCYQDPTVKEQRKQAPEPAPKGIQLKSGQSGLRPPGFFALPPGRLAAFGLGRSSSASSASSSGQSADGIQGDPCPPPRHPTAPPSGATRVASHSSPPNAPASQRHSLPPLRSSPCASRKEIHNDAEAVQPMVSTPKSFAVVSPKPQSPAGGRAAVRRGTQALEGAVLQELRERCEEQARHLQCLQAQLKKAFLGLEVFAITTQHFCQKSDSAIAKERELSLELARIRDEVACSVERWEHLQRDKQHLERHFEGELQRLQARQRGELGALEERLRAQHVAHTQRLKAQQRGELGALRTEHQEQIEEMSESHEATLAEMETAHNDTLATLQDEHGRTMTTLKMAHEQQRKSLEQEFEKVRLSLQDQVDTLTFQNRSLRDRAKRFEEALRKSTDEQIVDALAPYQHIEEDLKSLKEVLEMKNLQIHEQELKISELEKMAEKNVYLEERVQVLQQQNEDLKARIDKNVAVSRQLSEENANLQVHVELESKEKKRLSRTNEELLWRLQTGELSPRMSPASSPIHRASSGPGSPARPHSYHQ